MAPIILNLVTSWNEWSASHLGKEPQVPTDKRLGGPQSQSRQFSEEVSLLPQLGTEPQFLSCPVNSLVSTPTTQSQHLKKRIWFGGYVHS